MTDCLFCRILSGEVPSRRVYEDDTAIGFLDILPYHRGHTVLIPRRHVLDGISEVEAWRDVAAGIVAVGELLKAKLGAEGVNILSNAGAVAGQSVFHFHVHVIPRYGDNPGMAGLARRDQAAAEDLETLHAELVG